MDDSDQLNSEKLAVITGASHGIGFEMAQLFAEHGYNILIIADSDQIFEARDKLIDFGVDVEAIRADLSRFTEVEKIYEVISNSDYALDSVVLNAVIGLGGRFVDSDLQTELKTIQANCAAIVHLSKLIIPEMLNNKHGKILYTSSPSAEMPSSFLAVYAGSDAFVQSFAEALRFELQDSGVTVTILRPGSTETNYFHKDLLESPVDIAKAGFEAMMARKESIVAGSLKNKFKAAVTQILPEETQAKARIVNTKADHMQ
jgi:short-subunit dehydrogenase